MIAGVGTTRSSFFGSEIRIRMNNVNEKVAAICKKYSRLIAISATNLRLFLIVISSYSS
jgi:hypothetical protein